MTHIEDIEESVYSNIVVVSHHWPGITPFNVWDLEYLVWHGYVEAVKQLQDNNVGWWGVGIGG